MRADCGPCDEIFKDGWDFGSGGCPRGPDLRNELASFEQLVMQLEAQMKQLPHVDETGASECYFAEDLYAEKERLEREVLAGMTRLSGYLLALEKWIDRCEKNLERIEADAHKLNHAETQGCYWDAANHQRGEYRLAVQDKDAVYIALEKAKAVLQVSSTRKFPGREPQKRTFAPVGTPRGPTTSRRSSPGGDLGAEVEGLFSMGPVGEG
jgi:hypothetical protein